MALRLLELTVPASGVDSLRELLDEQPVLHVWISGAGEEERAVRILLDAEHVESLSDALLERLGSGDDVRFILLPVEATIPRIEEPEEEQAESRASDPSGPNGQGRISRDELYEDVVQASRVTLVYLVMVALSTVVAAVGVIRGDVAIIVGAMVIAPLLGPNVALSLACTLGDTGLATRALKATGAGIAVAAALSVLIGFAFEVDPGASELVARTRADLGDVGLALAAGAAGALAFTSGVSAVLVGVMVAVALLPPLVVAGLLAGAGHPAPALGAAVLALTNVACINLAAVATFLAQKIRPRTWWEAERARRATRIAVLSWVVMLVILVGVILSGYLEIT